MRHVKECRVYGPLREGREVGALPLFPSHRILRAERGGACRARDGGWHLVLLALRSGADIGEEMPHVLSAAWIGRRD